MAPSEFACFYQYFCDFSDRESRLVRGAGRSRQKKHLVVEVARSGEVPSHGQKGGNRFESLESPRSVFAASQVKAFHEKVDGASRRKVLQCHVGRPEGILWGLQEVHTFNIVMGDSIQV